MKLVLLFLFVITFISINCAEISFHQSAKASIPYDKTLIMNFNEKYTGGTQAFGGYKGRTHMNFTSDVPFTVFIKSKIITDKFVLLEAGVTEFIQSFPYVTFVSVSNTYKIESVYDTVMKVDYLVTPDTSYNSWILAGIISVCFGVFIICLCSCAILIIGCVCCTCL
jgi:hypothetical protein